MRALVLVDIKPSAGILVAAGRCSSAAVPAAVDDPSGAATPLVARPNVLSLSGWRRPYPTALPVGCIILQRRLGLNGFNFGEIAALLITLKTCCSLTGRGTDSS